ncbi:MAG: Holliday junction branch migration protein RuvA [Gammaproteobacteria bacterium]|nr:Holliday junction branch migration protein RuvA [Gammaproteobacteria bacterium]OUV68274.1 MAG: Holliday junction branch migration protein RuvA [Gammaproteobacteria bacterium TMED133]
MISRIRGVLLEKRIDQALVEVNGIGYEVEISLPTSERLGDLEEWVTLYTHLIIRDDAHTLYGFHTEKERELFRCLIKVNGVGPKLAVSIQSSIDSDSLIRCVRDNDLKALVSLPGIGKKTAEKLMIDMRDRLKDWESQDSLQRTNATHNDVIADAESALIGLGYKPQEAAIALAGIDEKNVELLIRLALRRLALNGRGDS